MQKDAVSFDHWGLAEALAKAAEYKLSELAKDEADRDCFFNMSQKWLAVAEGGRAIS